MKNIIYIIILIASSNIYAQNGIENDELFLKYEQEYFNKSKLVDIENYEFANKDFYSKFNDHKEKDKFRNTKDKERWLNKNLKKTQFKSENEAIESYNKIVSSKEVIDGFNNDIKEIRNELLKKYDVNLIWETLQNRNKSK